MYDFEVVKRRLSELLSQREELETEIVVLKYMLLPMRKKEANLSANELQELLRYDPNTGIFTWLKSLNHTGKQAGHLYEDGYRRIKLKGKKFTEHRLAWLYVTGEWPVFFVDHKNRNRADNRFTNLQDVMWSENNKSKGLHKNNTSGIKGISQHVESGRWYAQASHNGRRVYIGSYITKEEAAVALSDNLIKNNGIPKLDSYEVRN